MVYSFYHLVGSRDSPATQPSGLLSERGAILPRRHAAGRCQRNQLNRRDAAPRLTGPAILATFRTPEGFAVIKSELIDRITLQNPHLYRQHAEKIVNYHFFRDYCRNGTR
jgi:hypothetical protein